MTHWYLLSLVALLLLGTQRFLYKVAAERGCGSLLTTAVFMGTVTLLSGAAFLVTAERVQLAPLALLALANSTAFALATVANMEALRRLPATVAFPLTRLSLPVVILFSVVYLEERLDPFQWLGILLGLAVVGVLAGERGDGSGGERSRRAGYLFVALAILCGAVASISSKFAAVSTSKTAFMALSYLMGTGFSLAVERRWGARGGAGNPHEAVRIGVAMGLLNFCGFYAFLAALSTGPLSLIALITSMHFVIAILLSVLLYKERMTPRRSAALILTLLAVICLKL